MTKNEPFEYRDRDGRWISTVRHDAPPNFSDVVATMRYNGVRIRDISPEFRHDGRYDPRYTQAYSERNAVTFLLATSGYRDLDVTSKQPPFPDTQVTFPDASTAYIETAEVIESQSARFNGILNFVNVGISRALGKDAILEAKLKGHFIGVRAWMTSDGQYDANAILDQFLQFLRESELDQLPTKQMVAFGPKYPALAAIDAKYYYNRIKAISTPRFDPAAHSFGPESLAGQVIPILEQKRTLGPSYAGLPLWLALYMSDPLGVPELSLGNLSGVALDFGPFQKLLIGDQRSVIVYTVS